MEELVDAVVAEFKREAEQFPLDERLHKLYTYKTMLTKKVGQVMAEVSTESRAQQNKLQSIADLEEK